MSRKAVQLRVRSALRRLCPNETAASAFARELFGILAPRLWRLLTGAFPAKSLVLARRIRPKRRGAKEARMAAETAMKTAMVSRQAIWPELAWILVLCDGFSSFDTVPIMIWYGLVWYSLFGSLIYIFKLLKVGRFYWELGSTKKSCFKKEKVCFVKVHHTIYFIKKKYKKNLKKLLFFKIKTLSIFKNQNRNQKVQK